MGISTETEKLISLYNQKIELDKRQIEQVNITQTGYTVITGIGTTQNIKIWGPVEVIDTYNVPIKNIDNKIIEINNEIKTLQTQVLSLGQEANSVGCGTAGPLIPFGYTVITVYHDILKYQGYTFSGSNPFEEIDGNLISSNVGVGTYNYVQPTAIGEYYGPVGICNPLSFGCDPDVCVAYAASISALNSQISTLRTQRNNIISKGNFLKAARIQPELQNYAYEQSKVKLNEFIGISSSILSFLQDPANDEFL